MKLILKVRRISYVIAIGVINLLLAITPFSKLRVLLLKAIGVKCGRNLVVCRGVRLDFPWRLTINNNCYISKNVYFDCRGGIITIGESTDISEGALIYTLSHDIQSVEFKVKSGDVIVGNRNWICARAIILPGAHLATGNVLSANSVYSGTSEDFSLLVGNPAKPVKQLNSNRAIRVRQ